MASYSSYYSNARGAVMGISPKEAEAHGIDFGLAVAGGAAVALAKNLGKGTLDVKLGTIVVPGDALIAAGTSLVGLAMHSPEVKAISLGAAGAAGNRFFDGIFAKAMGVSASGEYDNMDLGEIEGLNYQTMGFGATEHDKLIAAAKQLAHR